MRRAVVDRSVLLAGTALASTLLVAAALDPLPAGAAQCTQPASPLPISDPGVNDSIICVNTDARTGANGYAIELSTTGDDHSIDLDNSGKLNGTNAVGDADGIHAATYGEDSRVDIVNGSGITATANAGNAYGYGIFAYTSDDASPIDIVNGGTVTATSPAGTAYGIFAEAYGADSPITIENRGGIAAVGDTAFGAHASSFGSDGAVTIVNSGDVAASGTESVGLYARTFGPGSSIIIENSGNIIAGDGDYNLGILASTLSYDSPTTIRNSGTIAVENTDKMSHGIFVRTSNCDSPLTIENSGDIRAASNGVAKGIGAATQCDDSPLTIVNNGEVAATGAVGFGIDAGTYGYGSPLRIENSGSVSGSTEGIRALSNTSTAIINSGSVSGSTAGIYAVSNTSTTIINSGEISAGSGLAIGTDGASSTIVNRRGGTITGIVDLTDDDDLFDNAGGTFAAAGDSDFGAGDDLFENAGTVRAAHDPGATEAVSFLGLEQFTNHGLVSLVDGKEGDTFTLPGDFAAGSGTLALDADLGGPGSTADVLVIGGDASGKTALSISNTSSGGGAPNSQGITIVEVQGNASAKNFFLPQPADGGFFDYDVFFEPGATSTFELRSFPGGGAFLLPQLVTAGQDIWYLGADTWFDRTQELRGLAMSGRPLGALGFAGPATATTLGGQGHGDPSRAGAFTPVAWVKGAGTSLDLDDGATTSAFGRSYQIDLDRDLDVQEVQLGIDYAARGLRSARDALVFGVLGGFVHADLDYDSLDRRFDYDGGEVGGYLTYLNNGLFFDALLKADFLDITTDTPGFPETIEATNIGVRADAGRRFGFGGGPFVEPFATIAAVWSDVDDFTVAANTVTFDEGASVRGRLGLRLGTTYAALPDATVEPFLTASLWGDLSGDDNEATLTSLGTTFPTFADDRPGAWGEVSTGVNVFSPSDNTTTFAKLDVMFGDEIDGFSGTVGVRTSW